MKYSKSIVAGLAALALAGCISLATGNTGATGYTGATGNTGAKGSPSGETILIVPAR